jgi:ubiquitin-conjugating enzyme E2 Z
MPPSVTRRVQRDVLTVTTTNAASLAAAGIYFMPDDASVMKGIAMLVGQKDTPYFGGFYFFSIEFPEDYPFGPVKVKTLTQDGYTRFNPNMYTDGKVCLSILNTWHDGPQWSGVQTLESVLLVIMSDVLHSNPITNEPAYRDYRVDHPDSVVYNRILWHANLHTAVCWMMTKTPAFAEDFKETMTELFKKNYEELLKRAEESKVHDGGSETSRIYRMTVRYDFKGAVEKLKSIKS